MDETAEQETEESTIVMPKRSDSQTGKTGKRKATVRYANMVAAVRVVETAERAKREKTAETDGTSIPSKRGFRC